MRLRIQAAEMNFPSQGGWAQLRDRVRVRSSDIWERLRLELLLLHIERSQLRWFGYQVSKHSGRLPGEPFQVCQSRRRPRDRPRAIWRDYISQLPWECPGVRLEELVKVAGERNVLISLLKPATLTQIKVRKQNETLAFTKMIWPCKLHHLFNCLLTVCELSFCHCFCV